MQLNTDYKGKIVKKDALLSEALRPGHEFEPTEFKKILIGLLSPLQGLKGRDREEYLSKLEKHWIQKKKIWIRKNRDKFKVGFGESLMDRVIRILYRSNLGISKKEMEIVEKTNNKLVVRFGGSHDCPLLSLLKELHLDTREICKRAYHEAYQYLLSTIDSRLRFDRDYRNLRPYGRYCIEIITLEENKK